MLQPNIPILCESNHSYDLPPAHEAVITLSEAFSLVLHSVNTASVSLSHNVDVGMFAMMIELQRCESTVW